MNTVSHVTSFRLPDSCDEHAAQWLEQCGDAVVLTDQAHVICGWNAAAARLWGWSAEEALGQRAMWFECAPGEPPPSWRELQYQTGVVRRRVSCRKDGAALWVESSWSLLSDSAGQPVFRLELARDVSARGWSDLSAAVHECEPSGERRGEGAAVRRRGAWEPQLNARANALSLLYDIASAANKAETVEEAIRDALRRVSEHCGWSYAHAFLPADEFAEGSDPSEIFYEAEPGRFAAFRHAALSAPLETGGDLPGRVFETGLPEWVLDLREERALRAAGFAAAPEVSTAAAFPVLMGDRVAAVLEFFSEQRLPPDAVTLETMASIGMQLGRVVERKLLERQIAYATVREQRRIGQELHDSVAQQLTGIALMAETLRQQLEVEAHSPARPEAARLLVEHIKNAQVQVRRLSRGLMPVEVDAGGLMSALAELAESHETIGQLHCRFECQQPVALQDNATATHLYRIAQESLQNVVKHAHAQHAVIRLEAFDDRVRLSICDDGIGMDLDDQTNVGIGQRILRYRAGVIGGVLEVQSTPGQGTHVICTIKQIDEETVS